MNCRFCQNPIAAEPVTTMGVTLAPTVCNDCDDANQSTIRLAVEKMRLERFNAICPAIYQTTDPERLPAEPLAKVLAWSPPESLIVNGPTRGGKTRSVWLRLRQLFLEGWTIEAVTDGEFARQCASAYGDGSAEEMFRRFTQPDVLFIDDFGKSKPTDRVECEVFDIIEHRLSRGRAIVITTNGTADTFKERFSANRGLPILRRLREFSATAHFKTQEEP